MSKIRTVIRLIGTPLQLIPPLSKYGLFDWLPDKEYLKLLYRCKMGYSLELKNPLTFSDKLQWLKLHDRKPSYTAMVDKYEVRSFVADKLGEDYLVPIIGVWNKPKDIYFNSLPNRFVLKCTHDSGGVIVCKDISELNVKAAKRRLRKCIRRNFFFNGREWPYKHVKPRIIVEEYLSDGKNEDLLDYKFFCFSGVPVYCQVITGRNSVKTMSFFDMNWSQQPFVRVSKPGETYPSSKEQIPKPVTFDKMKDAAERLSEGIPFVRVDFYEVQGKMYFGEITFYPASGFCAFEPKEWNFKLGEMIDLYNSK